MRVYVCELRGVNSVLIIGCMCCAEDTGSSVDSCTCLCVPLPSLSYHVSNSLSPCLLSKWGEEQCGSSKVKLSYGIKYMLLLLGED